MLKDHIEGAGFYPRYSGILLLPGQVVGVAGAAVAGENARRLWQKKMPSPIGADPTGDAARKLHRIPTRIDHPCRLGACMQVRPILAVSHIEGVGLAYRQASISDL